MTEEDVMRRHGYGLLVAAGLLAGPLTLAQGTPQSSAPAPHAKGTGSQQANSCPCGQMMGGGMMGQGMGGAGMGCPMRGMADVTVEQTPTGAILRLTAKSPDQVAKVQQHAQMMKSCMGGGQEGESKPVQKKQ